jgi:hypothetical protein
MAVGVLDNDGAAGRIAAGLVVSLALHLALLLALMIPAPPHAPPDEPGITVEILPAEPEAVAPPIPGPITPAPAPASPSAVPTPRLATPPPPAATPAAPTETVPPGWTAAGTLVSARHLAEPKNRAVANHIAAMPSDLRDEQLCDFEAMEQIGKPGKPADQVVAYAFADTHQDGDQTIAEGAAVRIAGTWYRLAFRCRVTGHPAAVVGFAHRLGSPIPRRDWSDHGLAAGGDD